MYGIDRILQDIQEFSEEDPFFWKPSELLQDLVSKGQTFDDLNLQ